MTVRVNKSSFNIREKLSELERPIGMNGAALMATNTPQDAFNILQCGRKNSIINGGFDVWQRGTSGSGTYVTFVADRWMGYGYTTNSVTMSRQSSSSSDQKYLDGSKYFMRITENFDRCWLTQYIENSEQFCGNWWTLSFMAKSSNIASLGAIEARCYINGAGSYLADDYRDWTETIPDKTLSSNWKKYEYSFYIPTTEFFSGSWSNTSYFAVTIASLGTGTLDVANVQLEKGKVSTPFEHRSYGEELALCQRYYEKFSADDGNGGYATFCGGGKSSNTVIVAEPVFRVPKRAVGATMTWGGDIRIGGVAGVSDITMNSIQNAQLGIHGGYVVLVISSSTNPPNGADGYRIEGSGDTNAYIAFSSEL